MPWRCCVLFGLWLIVAGGCAKKSKPPAPPSNLHSVNGIVRMDGVPVAGGSLQIAHQTEDSAYMVTAAVGADGHFELLSLDTLDHEGKKLPGAPAGTYKVTYYPDYPDEETEPTEAAQVFKVEPDRPNQWEIELVHMQ